MTLPRCVLVSLVAFLAFAAPAPGGPSEHAEIEALVQSSRGTYFAFQDWLHWGRNVSMHVARVNVSRTNPKIAGAFVVVRNSDGKLAAPSQQVLLRKNAEAWRIAKITLASDGFRCAGAAPGVMRELFGRCSASGPGSILMMIRGPEANRLPSLAERAAISAGVRTYLRGHDSDEARRCLDFDIRVSRVDARFASASASTAAARRWQRGACRKYGYNGVAVMRRSDAGTWRTVDAASDAFDCRRQPAGVLRSLFGECWIYRTR